MQYDVTIGERTRRVVVQRDGERWRVLLDGTAHWVDAARVGDALASLAVTPPPPGRSIWHYDEIAAAAATVG